MRIFAFLFFLISATSHAQSIDDLLHQADSILQNKTEPAPAGNKKSHVKKSEMTDEERDDEEDEAAAQEAAKPTQPTLTKQIEETQPADLRGVVELDARAARQSAERQKRTFASVALLVGVDHLKEGYGFEKKEDTFSTTNGSLQGGAFEIESSSIVLGSPTSDFSLRFGATLGYYKGDVQVQRAGVFNENRTYEYTMVPGDGFARLAWQPLSWFEMSTHAGLGLELLQQNGAEDTDTSSMVCFGPLVGAQLRWIIQDRISIFALAERKGVGARATQNTIAGNHYALGTSFNLFL